MPPAVIYQDNKSAMAMFKAGKGSSALSKHIDHRYFWIKDFVEDGQIIIEYLHTDSMICDVLTKPLQGDKFRRLRALLMNHTDTVALQGCVGDSVGSDSATEQSNR
jgi:hypothetical protein